MSEIERMFNRVGLLGIAVQTPSTGEIIGWKPMEFTAEKQLKIVKMILFSTWWINLKRLQFSEKFDEGLAKMINELWQDLTEEEKQQVRGILE